ncbi:MAG: 50S ribosomal protein L29 [Candidatus Obscuribacterales bacterium]|nr:50S ribosomal protein L29 [Candidatus Obscuribacterales bacterium]
MRVKEVRDLSAEELNAKVADTRKEIVELRFQLAGRKLENPAAIRVARKRLSRLLTIQTERELGLKR